MRPLHPAYCCHASATYSAMIAPFVRSKPASGQSVTAVTDHSERPKTAGYDGKDGARWKGGWKREKGSEAPSGHKDTGVQF